MKKLTLILCVVSMILAAALGVAASDGELNIGITDVKNDIVTISGAAAADTLVSVRIYNPGFSSATVDSSADVADTAAIQYFGTALSKNGQFSISVPMNTKDGGLFTVQVSVGKAVYEDTFTFYPYGKKVGYVTTLKNATNPAALATSVPEIMEIYGYANHELYKATTASAVANAIVASNGNAPLYTPTDADAFLKEVLVLTAFQAKNEALLFTNGKLNYADMIGITDTDWYKDYAKSILSAEGIARVKSDMIAGTYTTIEDVQKQFVSSMCFSAIMKNAYTGGGHVEGLLNKYEKDYTDAGFDLDLLDTATGQKALFVELVSSDAATLKALAEKFNDLFDGEDIDSGGGSGAGSGAGSGGGGGFGGGSPAGGTGGGMGAASGDNLYIQPENPGDTQQGTVSSYPFADMASADWAKEAVKALYDKKIINGKSATEFAPHDAVTRAEFVKMIAEAFGVKAGEEEAAFEDVPEGAWYASYIKRVASAGIIKGDGKNFSPEGRITRQDAAVIVARVLKLESSEAAAFADSGEVSDYAVSAVAALSEKKIMNGMGDNNFAPKANLTRAEAAQLIYNILQGGVLN